MPISQLIVAMATAPAVGTDITSQAAESPSPFLLSNGINVRYSR